MSNQKKMSRRDFLKLATLAGGAGMLAACGVKETALPPTAVPTKAAATTAASAVEATAAPAKLSVAPGTKLTMKLRAAFMPQGNEILKAVILDWGAKNEIPVEVDIVSMNDLQTIAATAAETGAGPDIIEINQGSAHLFAEKLADVTDVCEDLAARYNGFYVSAEEACKVDGKWLSVPRFYAPHAISYRKDLFEQVGFSTAPATWEELYQAGKALMDAGLAPIAFPLGHAVGDGNDFCYSVLWSHGASDVAADGKTVTINSAETRAALEYMNKLFSVMPPDTLSYDDASNNRAFLAGAISATNNASTIWGAARNQGTKVKVGEEEKNLHELTDHFVYPSGPAGRVTYAEFMSSAILGYSPNLAAAKALLTFLNEREQYTPWANPNLSFVFPPLKGMKDDILMPWNTTAKLAPFKDYAETSHLPGFPSTNFRAGTEAYAKWLVVDMFANVCGGLKSVDEAIAETETQLKSIYG
ncbi:MAG: substrate-binding domain-containing protein [Anaerolineae bacterium]|nr:substrate-binding domain-containing protein [Anaerolineae bacterium]